MARILIVEDNAVNMELMVFLLKAYGHAVQCATDGAEGLAAVRDGNFDLVVCDIHLPEVDGYGVLRGLREDAATRRLPVIAVTALAMVGDRDKVLAAGFNGYISKPVDPESFAARIDAHLPEDRRSVVPAPPSAPSAVVQRADASRARLLVVDDSAINADLIRNTLEPFGYTVEVAQSTEAALLRVAQERFDLILSDLHMPGRDGIDFLCAVKREPALAAVPFVLISASMEDGTWQPAMELGACKFLRRPIEPEQLIAEIESCLAGSE